MRPVVKRRLGVRSAEFLHRTRWGSSVRVFAFGALLAALTTVSPEWEGGKRNETLARVENERITTGYFLYRYENFLLSATSKDSWRVRRQFLDNLLNERLIIRQIYDEGITGDREFQDKVHAVRTQALLDGYRRKAVIDKITVTEDELKQAFARSNTRVRARHLYASTEPEARELYELVMAGATFDSLARLFFADSVLASNGGDLGFRIDHAGDGVVVDVAVAGDDLLGTGDALFLGLVGQHWPANNVADGIDAFDGGSKMLVDGNAALLVEFCVSCAGK